MADDADTKATLEKRLREELESSPFVMLGLQGVDDSFTRPMTAQLDDGKIWFFASRSEDLVRNLSQSDRAVATFASKGHGLFASIHGTLSLDNRRDVIDRLWSPMVASWYKDGKDDPDLALIRFDTEKADVWEATAGSSLKAAAMKMFFNADPKQQQEEQRAEVDLQRLS